MTEYIKSVITFQINWLNKVVYELIKIFLNFNYEGKYRLDFIFIFDFLNAKKNCNFSSQEIILYEVSKFSFKLKDEF